MRLSILRYWDVLMILGCLFICLFIVSLLKNDLVILLLLVGLFWCFCLVLWVWVTFVYFAEWALSDAVPRIEGVVPHSDGTLRLHKYYKQPNIHKKIDRWTTIKSLIGRLIHSNIFFLLDLLRSSPITLLLSNEL